MTTRFDTLAESIPATTPALILRQAGRTPRTRPPLLAGASLCPDDSPAPKGDRAMQSPDMRVAVVGGEVHVPVQDMLLWLRRVEEGGRDGGKCIPASATAGHLADSLRDAWIDACQWEGNR